MTDTGTRGHGDTGTRRRGESLTDKQLDTLQAIEDGKESWCVGEFGRARTDLPYVHNEGLMISEEVWLATVRRLRARLAFIEGQNPGTLAQVLARAQAKVSNYPVTTWFIPGVGYVVLCEVPQPKVAGT